jgi:hypothetical protein
MATKTATRLEGKSEQAVENLLYQLLETELGGVEIYRTALTCVTNDDLREELRKYLEETERHVAVARQLLEAFELDPGADVPARLPLRTTAQGLVKAMERALASGDKDAAQITATECVVEAETKDHANWSLIGMLAESSTGDAKKALQAAYDEVEDDEDHHLYHATGWARELWIQALGLPAVLPPPEEEKDVQTAIGAARAKNARKDMLPGRQRRN